MDKLYSSASEALQAYIDDFDLSREHSGANTGRVNIDEESGNMLRFSSYVHKPNNAFENLDHKQHLNSLCYRRETINDMDSISLTTDDLLRLPADGSFSFTSVIPGHRPNSFIENKGLVNQCKCDSENGQCHCENLLLPGQSPKPFCGDKIELLILKAKKNLRQSTEDLAKPVEKDDSPCSLDKLEAERSWENVPVTFKSPVPVNADDSPQQSSGTQCIDEILEDSLNDENQVFEFPGGAIQWARYRNNIKDYLSDEEEAFGTSLNSLRSQMTLGTLRIKSKGLRAPHWHFNANEHGYLVQGTAWIGVIDEGGEVATTYNVTAGQVIFFPQNTLHWIKNVGHEDCFFLLFFSTHDELQTLDLDDAFFSTPEDIASRSLKVGIINTERTIEFNIHIGDVVFFPMGTQHYIKNTCDEDLLFVLAFSTRDQVQTLDMDDYLLATSDHILAQLFFRKQSEFKKIPKFTEDQAINLP
ncbi:hypothetical protein NN561_011067 [Cricetulus griseus]